MENNNQYILKWREHVLKAAEALKNHDYETYEAEIGEMEQAYSDFRKDEQLSYKEENTFGAANEMFESALPKLFINNKQAVKDFVTTIKEDKNLHSQFMFLSALKKYKKDYDLKNYINESIGLAMEHVDANSVAESNKKLYDVIRKHNIKPVEFIDEGKLSFYRDCNKLFETKKSLKNLNVINETVNRISSYVQKESELIEEAKTMRITTVEEFAKKCNLTLTENEKSFLYTLLNPNSEKARQELFENQKNECLNKIKALKAESDDETIARLETLAENLSNKTYNKQTILEDMVKIMEITEILNA